MFGRERRKGCRGMLVTLPPFLLPLLQTACLPSPPSLPPPPGKHLRRETQRDRKGARHFSKTPKKPHSSLPLVSPALLWSSALLSFLLSFLLPNFTTSLACPPSPFPPHLTPPPPPSPPPPPPTLSPHPLALPHLLKFLGGRRCTDYRSRLPYPREP